MLVSWQWLKDYVDLPASHEEATARLMMAGLNHESTEKVGGDFCIDLEITNNRPDCLGHLGVAREIAVLFGQALKVPAPNLKEGTTNAADLTSVTIECPQLCSRYIARVIRGVRIKPSPAWLQDRLRTIGITVINNVVDITNYVMMECGQPLHAFDLARLKGRRIIVREARPQEPFLAINHQTYALEPGMCVIADAERPVALGGVMGGAETEVGEGTTEVLLEAAQFSQLAIRFTARKLKLHSPSSYRFERGLDPEAADWASRRACELILDLAGGESAAGSVDVGQRPGPREPITLRLSEVKRLLGIDIPAPRIEQILRELGLAIHIAADASTAAAIVATPPSWRRDLTREIDLIEEAARIHGYDKIPEDAAVPMAPSHRSDADRVLGVIRRVMTAAGFDEAVTTSVVTPEMSAAFSPWTDAEPLATNQPMLKGTDRIRRSLTPSLLDVRQKNEGRGNAVIELFETAKVYLPQTAGLPREQLTLSATSGGDYYALKGVLEALLSNLNPDTRLAVKPTKLPLLEFGKSVELSIDDSRLGVLGVLSADGRRQFGLRGNASILEVDVGVLERIARLVPQYRKQSPFPAVVRDVNLIVDEKVRWAELEHTIAASAGDELELVKYLDTYRDPQKDGSGKKRLLFSMSLRSPARTLTSEEVDQIRDRVVKAAGEKLGAVLLG